MQTVEWSKEEMQLLIDLRRLKIKRFVNDFVKN